MHDKRIGPRATLRRGPPAVAALRGGRAKGRRPRQRQNIEVELTGVILCAGSLTAGDNEARKREPAKTERTKKLVIINPHSRHCHTEATAQQSYGLSEKAVSKISRLDEQIKNKFRPMARAACSPGRAAPRSSCRMEARRTRKASRIFDLRCVIGSFIGSCTCRRIEHQG